MMMNQIPQEHVRDWSVLVDGKEKRVGIIEIDSKFGKLTYGLRPEGYDGWVFREQGGGGGKDRSVHVRLPRVAARLAARAAEPGRGRTEAARDSRA